VRGENHNILLSLDSTGTASGEGPGSEHRPCSQSERRLLSEIWKGAAVGKRVRQFILHGGKVQVEYFRFFSLFNDDESLDKIHTNPPSHNIKMYPPP